MGVFDRIGGLANKRVAEREVDNIQSRLNIAPKLVNEVLEQQHDIKTYTIETIRKNESHQRLFKQLLDSMYSPTRAEQLVNALENDSLTPTDTADIKAGVEEFRARFALAMTVNYNMNSKALRMLSGISDDLQTALGNYASEDAVIGRVNPKTGMRAHGVFNDFVWKNVMGDPSAYQKVRAIAEQMDAVRERADSPEKAEAEAVLNKQLAKRNMNFTQLEQVIDLKDRDASIKNIREIIDEKNYSKGWWRKFLGLTGAGKRAAEDIYERAMNPAAGGLAAAEQDIEKEAGKLGDVLALSLSEPWVQQELQKAARGAVEEKEHSFRFLEDKKIQLDSAKRLADIAKHMGRRWFWNEYKAFVKEHIKQHGGTHLADQSLTDQEVQTYMQAFLPDFYRRLAVLYKRAPILIGSTYKSMLAPIVANYEHEMLNTNGRLPPEFA